MRNYQPIGYINSCFKETFATPRQPSVARCSYATLEILPQFRPQDSLKGLEQFSHLWLIFDFHEVIGTKFVATVHPPRLQGKGMGVFATRSPHRPNNIGLSLVKLDKIEKNILYLSGVDLLDKTPVLDIKPYLPNADKAPGAKAVWVSENKFPKLTVKIPPGVKETITAFEGENSKRFIKLLNQMFSQDITACKDKWEITKRLKNGLKLGGYKVKFSLDNSVLTVTEILSMKDEK